MLRRAPPHAAKITSCFSIGDGTCRHCGKTPSATGAFTQWMHGAPVPIGRAATRTYSDAFGQRRFDRTTNIKPSSSCFITIENFNITSASTLPILTLPRCSSRPSAASRVRSGSVYNIFFKPGAPAAPPKYRDMLLQTGTEEIGHIEMLATAVALNLEKALQPRRKPTPPSTRSSKCARSRRDGSTPYTVHGLGGDGCRLQRCSVRRVAGRMRAAIWRRICTAT